MNSPNITVLNVPVVFLFHYFPLFPTPIFASTLFFPSQLNFCVKRNLELKTTFLYHVISEILLVRYTNTVRGLEKSTVKIAHICSIFEASTIPLINLPLKDESLYACSWFFFSRAGKLADCFISDATPRFIPCDTTEEMLSISSLFTEPLLRQQAQLFLDTSNRNLQMQPKSSRKGEVLYLIFHAFP